MTEVLTEQAGTLACLILPLRSHETIQTGRASLCFPVVGETQSKGGATPLLCSGCFQWPLSCRQVWVGTLNTDVGAGTPYGSHCSPSLSKP